MKSSNADVVLRCEALLFDLDGVLVDSRACVERILREWAHAHALDAARVIAVAHGRRTVETIGLVAQLRDAFLELWVSGRRHMLEIYPGDAWRVGIDRCSVTIR
jgi:beta-phosphoglucomutase-like phosphatase (HAD superfamily)